MMCFSPSVPVRSATEAGLTHNVSDVLAASEQLLKWTKRGPMWRKAVEACVHAREGKKSPTKAGKAFEAAAKESGMLRNIRICPPS